MLQDNILSFDQLELLLIIYIPYNWALTNHKRYWKKKQIGWGWAGVSFLYQLTKVYLFYLVNIHFIDKPDPLILLIKEFINELYTFMNYKKFATLLHEVDTCTLTDKLLELMTSLYIRFSNMCFRIECKIIISLLLEFSFFCYLLELVSYSQVRLRGCLG